MSVLCSQNLEPRRVALLCRLAEPDVCGALLVVNDERADCPGGSSAVLAITRRRELPHQCRLICRIEFVGAYGARQWATRAAIFAKIDPDLAVPIAPAFNEWRQFARHQRRSSCRQSRR